MLPAMLRGRRRFVPIGRARPPDHSRGFSGAARRAGDAHQICVNDWYLAPGPCLSVGMSQYHDEPLGDHPRLEEFDRGPWTQYAQERLQFHGYEPQDHKIDGLFGPMTKEAVRDFQGHWGLEVTGVIDERTWELLEGTPA